MNSKKDNIALMKKILARQDFENVVWGLDPKDNHVVVFCRLDDYKVCDFLSEYNYYVILNSSGETNIEEENVSIAELGDFLSLQKECLNQLFPIDWKKKKLIGVTGTNGKTSVVNFVEQLLNLNNVACFSLGTLGVKKGNKVLDTINGMTTPGMIDLHKMLYKQFAEFDVAAIEVSSHGVALNRIYGLEFDIVAWTNFTQDHLDFHKSLEDYFNAKKKFFDTYMKSGGRRFLSDSDTELIKKLEVVEKKKISSPFEEESFSKLPLNVNSGFNLKNIELAYLIAKEFMDEVSGLERLRPVSGRFEVVESEKDNRTYIVDYAHTPDALKNVLSTAKECYPDKKIHILFGCGGERDRDKRAKMGEIASQEADVIFLTNDNPRNEDPVFIINDIKKGIDHDSVAILHDRRSAIRLAVKTLPDDGCLIIAGKGHEDYQIIGEDRIFFSDIEVLQEMVSDE